MFVEAWIEAGRLFHTAGPDWGAHSAPPDPPGTTSKRREGGDGERSGAGRRNLVHPKKFGMAPL